MSWIFQDIKNIPVFTFASSYNLHENTTYYPVIYDKSITGRWCGKELKSSSPQWWSFSLPQHKIKIKKYLVSTQENYIPKHWKLEAFKYGKWITIQEINDSQLAANDKKEYEIDTNPSFYSTFRMWTDKISNLGDYYHFCIHKFDIKGPLIQIIRSNKSNSFISLRIMIFIFILT